MGLESEIKAFILQAVSDGVVEGTARALAELRGSRSTARAGLEIDPDEEIDADAAAVLAHVRPRTISDWKRRGWLTPTKRGRSYVYRAGDVLAVARDRGGPRKIVDLKKEAQRILRERKS